MPAETPIPSDQATSPIRDWKRLGIFALICCALLPFGLFMVMVSPGPNQENQTVVIPRGSSVSVIGHTLYDKNIVFCPFLMKIATRLISPDGLKAGEYEFTAGQSAAEIVLMMHYGKSVVHQITLAEGLTSQTIITTLNQAAMLTGTVAEAPPEGSLLPETYNFSLDDTRQSIVDRMIADQKTYLAKAWTGRDQSIPLKTPEEAVTLASVVEKETGIAGERPRIAGVFYNRLRHSMRLQSDPTVIYAIEKTKGPPTGALGRDLTKDDLQFPSPYNTYASDGLPQGPICNPGRAAIDAVLHPEAHDYLYFVADGQGGHRFAKTLEEHNHNVALYRRQ